MSPDADSADFTVLIVDDDPDSLALLQNYLKRLDVCVLVAQTGLDAMRVLAARRVHIVVADWMMPDVTGLDLCRWVHSRPPGEPSHFVLLTSRSEGQHVAEAFQAGVDDFLSKTVGMVELVARFRAWARFVQLQEELAGRNAQTESMNRKLSAANAELEAMNAKLSDLAAKDELTQLPNRREALRRLTELCQIAARYNQPLSCALIDVDHFKQINDKHGHAVGDAALREIASVLSRCVRAADGVFRLGGDEFLALFVNQTRQQASICAERCRDAVEAAEVAGLRMRCTISIGLSEWSVDNPSPSELLQAVDKALYAAKRGGRNAAHVESGRIVMSTW